MARAGGGFEEKGHGSEIDPSVLWFEDGFLVPIWSGFNLSGQPVAAA
jgi:hypothetical protein